ATEPAARRFRGWARPASIAVNPQKWRFVPAEAACILVREPQALRDTFQIAADYFGDERESTIDGPLDFKDYGPQLSRNFRALKVWLTFKAYGARKLRAAIESNINVMRYLAERIDQSDDFVRLAPVSLSTVCFQYRPPDISAGWDQTRVDTLNNRLSDALERDGRMFVSGTKIHGKTVLRACSVNHRLRRDHIDSLLDVIRE